MPIKLPNNLKEMLIDFIADVKSNKFKEPYEIKLYQDEPSLITTSYFLGDHMLENYHSKHGQLFSSHKSLIKIMNKNCILLFGPKNIYLNKERYCSPLRISLLALKEGGIDVGNFINELE